MAMKMPASPVDPAKATRTRRVAATTVGALGTAGGRLAGIVGPGIAVLTGVAPDPAQPVSPKSAPAPSIRPAPRRAARRPILRAARPLHGLWSAIDSLP